MTDDMRIHKQAFLEEAAELLAELESSLLEWENRPEDSALVDRVFRAMHTIKGSGAMFGYDDISSFAHEVETLLDMVREGLLSPEPGIIDLTLEARDHMAAMLAAVDQGGSVAEDGRTRRLVAEFRAVSSRAGSRRGNGGHATSPPGQESTPGCGERGEDTLRTWWVRFVPDAEIMRRGTDPLGLVRELGELGQTWVLGHADGVPPLSECVADHCYICWDVLLATSRDLNALRDVFIFVEDECLVRILPLDGAVSPEQASELAAVGRALVERGDLTAREWDSLVGAAAPCGPPTTVPSDAPPLQPGTSPAPSTSATGGDAGAGECESRTKGASLSVSSIRVPAARLDKLVDLVGEMVTVQARLTRAAERLHDDELRAVAEEVESLTWELRENAMSCRMLPIGTLFGKFKRVVRDMSHSLGKEVDFVLAGEQTELDKTVIERLNDPLVHLLRNAMDHGIETPDVRRAAGKPDVGSLWLSAEHAGSSVLVKIRDDGRGLDAAAIRARAEDQGLIQPDTEIPEKDLFRLVFHPGFSTSTEVTDVSGRGVGMDVVKRGLERLKGSIDIHSTAGQGTEITLRLPLTLAIIDGLLVATGDDHFIIPTSATEECVELTAEDVRLQRGRRTVCVREELIPYVRLRDRFGVNGGAPDIEKVVIVRDNDARFGFVVDRVIGDHQTVIKNLGRFLQGVEDVSGATILGDGTVALILDVQRMMSTAHGNDS
ncbi:MAG: chemotaxis protein CheA [Desulfatibacillaceae bacterium]